MGNETPQVSKRGTRSCNDRRASLTLRQLRERRKLSIPNVESITGISRATISRVERGIEVPTPAHMVTFSRLYRVSPADWKVVLEYRIDEKAVPA